jgi:hypothetical protein
MPYIKKQDRDKYALLKSAIELKEIQTKGDLEYIVTLLMKQYMSTRERRYATLHEVVYAVQHASDEYRRRHLDKRETEALEANGDV